MKAKPFEASQFTPTQWSTAEEKAKFANHLMRFIEKDFPQTLFTKTFYNRLMNTFGHIAHYNIAGFWETFFTDTRKKVEFLKQTVHPWTGFCGDQAFTFSDVERAVSERVRASGYLSKYEKQLAVEIETGERALLARLKNKYEAAPSEGSSRGKATDEGS